MPDRYLYLLDERTGQEVMRWPVDGMNMLQITQLERRILAECGDDVSLRDSAFDND
jgi:hypothetical protein